MGHAEFGARVVYGDCIFFTISPNEQHSALVLRLSRYRAQDPYLQEATEDADTLREMGKRDSPALETSTTELPIPDYEQRRIMTARDPLAVMEAYMVEVRVRLACALGLRMCPICPRCNETAHPCQDEFGSNMMPLGGVINSNFHHTLVVYTLVPFFIGVAMMIAYVILKRSGKVEASKIVYGWFLFMTFLILPSVSTKLFR